MLVRLLQSDPILRDDPVRPKISPKRRIDGADRGVYAWVEDKQICAIVCVSYSMTIPEIEKELFIKRVPLPSKVILYSVWSYKKGAASKLVRTVVKLAKKQELRVITMSPKTDMARNFHLKNGARLLKTNKTTINYEY